MATGIRKLHSMGCPGRDAGRCSCGAGWEASVFSKRDGKKIRKTFANKAEAKSWRDDANTQLTKGALRAPKPISLRDAWDAWQDGARNGTVTNRSGDPYKPSALRSYERAMRLRILPEIGGARLADIRRSDLQGLADRFAANKLDPSTVRCTMLPVRAVFRRAVSRGDLAVNPCDGLELAASRARRDRVAAPEEAEALIAAVPERDRAIWATAMYAGLRRGELKALRDDDVDLAAGVIRVEHGWDEKEGEIELKTAAGRRRVPIALALRDILTEHRIRSGRSGAELIFGRGPSWAFNGKALQDRADTAWRKAGLERITPHECRHTFASLMIAAGVNAKALSTFMGHANISVTMDRYGHLMPGSEEEAAALLDSYLQAQQRSAEEAARMHGECLTGELTGEQIRTEESETA
ncbi:MAG: tyrosine-type recombinase/integrase [Solirubrobacterales bacterium]